VKQSYNPSLTGDEKLFATATWMAVGAKPATSHLQRHTLGTPASLPVEDAIAAIRHLWASWGYDVEVCETSLGWEAAATRDNPLQPELVFGAGTGGSDLFVKHAPEPTEKPSTF